jgi:hypothetical protein
MENTESSNRSHRCVKRNHLLNLLNRNDYTEDIDYFNFDIETTPSPSEEDGSIDLDQVAQNLKRVIKTKEYRNPKNILHRLNVKLSKRQRLLTISVSNVSDNLRYSDPVLNRVLHQSRAIVFDTDNYYPLFYVENRIDSSDISPINRENSYLTKHLYSVMPTYRDGEFDPHKVRCYKNHIGSYIVIFYNPQISDWMFYFSGKSYRLCIEKHAVLFEHIGRDLDKLNQYFCYHVLIVDPRLRIPLQCPSDSNYMVLIKVNRKYTLEEYGIEHSSVPPHLFVEDKRLYFSCLDQLDLYLEEMNNVNIKNKKLYNRGLIVKVDIDEYDPIHIIYDTYTYKRLRDMLPKGMTVHEAHLHLYQTDRLNQILQYVEDSDNAALIVTRINLAIVTLGREILDIYHFTRNKENPELFALLSRAYRDLMHNLHGQFIQKKSDAVSRAQQNPRADIEKVSISTEDVYVTLKNMDTLALVELFLDREKLKEDIEQSADELDSQTVSIIKECNSTSLQIRLLKK